MVAGRELASEDLGWCRYPISPLLLPHGFPARGGLSSTFAIFEVVRMELCNQLPAGLACIRRAWSGGPSRPTR